jgi:hypothetical protein
MKQYSQDKPYSGYIDENVIPPGHRAGETAFERRMVMEERQERRDAINRYAVGLQGRDGGPKPHDPL